MAPRLTSILLAAALCGTVGPAVAQAQLVDLSPVRQERLRAEADTLAEVRTRLSWLFVHALERNPDLVRDMAAHEEALARAVDEILPAAPDHRAHLAELEAAYNEALEAGQNAVQDSLLAEGSELQTALQTARLEASRQPELLERARALEQRLVARLSELDPEAAGLLEREEALVWSFWAAVLVR